mmetsp:Transcript_53211/g.105703  ORF Transcript_53211/g.105703 Transcript_53211/m.105703 type:complete len:304 (+) Transcript_53211:39-950(+)
MMPAAICTLLGRSSHEAGCSCWAVCARRNSGLGIRTSTADAAAKLLQRLSGRIRETPLAADAATSRRERLPVGSRFSDCREAPPGAVFPLIGVHEPARHFCEPVPAPAAERVYVDVAVVAAVLEEKLQPRGDIAQARAVPAFAISLDRPRAPLIVVMAHPLKIDADHLCPLLEKVKWLVVHAARVGVVGVRSHELVVLLCLRDVLEIGVARHIRLGTTFKQSLVCKSGLFARRQCTVVLEFRDCNDLRILTPGVQFRGSQEHLPFLALASDGEFLQERVDREIFGHHDAWPESFVGLRLQLWL